MKNKRLWTLLLFLLLAFVPARAEAKVKLNTSKKTITISQTYQLKVKGSSGKVKWSSKNSKICSVSQKGKIRGKMKGTTYVTATVDGKKYSCKVKVIRPSINTSVVLKKGQKKKIVISNKSSFSKITYKSSNKKVAKVTSKGVISGVKRGYTTIKVRFNKAYTVKVKVWVGYTYTYSTVSVMKGSSKTLTPANAGKNGRYSVLNSSKGYVSAGVYHSKAYGINTVTYTNGYSIHTFTIRNYCWEAHRGYTKVYPDNTLESIRAAKAAGANSVEIDVRVSRDGVFVLSHNSNLSSSTNGKLPNNVRNYYLSSLQKQNYIYKNGVYYHLPTLAEALQLANELGLNVSVEMKTLPSVTSTFEWSKEQLTKELVNTIKKYGNSKTSIIVTSVENATLLGKYSGGSILVRATNDSYAKSAQLRKIVDSYSFMMSSTQFALKYYAGYLLTQDNPF